MTNRKSKKANFRVSAQSPQETPKSRTNNGDESNIAEATAQQMIQPEISSYQASESSLQGCEEGSMQADPISHTTDEASDHVANIFLKKPDESKGKIRQKVKPKKWREKISPESDDESSKADKECDKDSSKAESSSSSDNEDDSYLDIPDSQRILGSGREDQRFKNRKGKTNSKSQNQSSRKIINEKSQSDKKEATRRLQREKVVQSYLENIMKTYPDGIRLDSIIQVLEQNKIRNFDPQLLGYDSLEDWAKAQPAHIIMYNQKTNLIMPGRLMNLETHLKPGSSSESSLSSQI